MIISFFIFAFVNGIIHEMFISPGIGSESVLELTNQLLPIIGVVSHVVREWVIHCAAALMCQ